MLRYVVLVPISHNGQRIADGALVNDSERYGLTVKTPLPIARLLEQKRIAPAAAPEPPADSPTETGASPAPEPAAAPEPPASKRKGIL